MKTCSLCGGGYRSWPAHFGSKRHQRAMHPVASRKSSRANAGRARRRAARHTLTKRWERDMWGDQQRRERADAQASGRHHYGRWTPWGVSAFMGGHPGRGGRRELSLARVVKRLVGRR